MKKTRLSIIAASAALGAGLLFTGCGSSSSSSAAAGSFTGQASVVSQLETGALTLTFADTNGICFNNKMINTTGQTINFSASDLNASPTAACSESLTGEYEYSVNTAISSFDYNTSNVLMNKVGTEFKGAKGKNVNIFSTIAVANGDEVVNIDVNGNASIKALKALIQAKTAVGTSVLNFADLNMTKVSEITADTNLTAEYIPNNVLTALGNISLANITALRDAFDANSSATFEDAAASIPAIKDLSAAATAAKTTEKLAVSSISLSVGDDLWSAASNNFAVSKATSQEVNATDDVVLSINAAALNSFAVDTTLKAVVKTAANTLTVTLDGVSISTSESGKVSATVAAGSTLSLVSSYSGIATISGTIDSDMTTSDLSFSLNDLIAGISTNTAAITDVKEDILTTLAEAKTYEVAVGLSGITTEITNLNAVTCLGSEFKGFEGTVTVGAVAVVEDTNTTDGTSSDSSSSDVLTQTAVALDNIFTTPFEYDTNNPPAVPGIDYFIKNIVVKSTGTGAIEISGEYNESFTVTVDNQEETISLNGMKFEYASENTGYSASTITGETPSGSAIEVTGLESGTTYQFMPVTLSGNPNDPTKNKIYSAVFSITIP